LVVPYKERQQLASKSKSNVSKLSLETEVESHSSALQLEITELKSLLLSNESDFKTKKENQRPRARFEPAFFPIN
jgi:hypothetical protein